MEWVAELLAEEPLRRKGHCQRLDDDNLGMGWLYYALARLVRPRTIVVIGSWRGFSPLVFGVGLMHNLEHGELLFVDPSHVDGFWTDPGRTREYFADRGAPNVRHFLMTTQEFVHTDEYRALDEVGVVFIDGYHSEAQARFDFEAFEHLLAPDGLALFHDSIDVATTPIYGAGAVYERRVCDFIETLRRRDDLQILDLPFAKGLSIVRRVCRERSG